MTNSNELNSNEFEEKGWKNLSGQVAINNEASQVREALYNSDAFSNASLGFQKMTMALVNSQDNQQYLASALKNEKVIEREDFALLEKISSARTWLKASDAKNLSPEEIKKESNNYHHIMATLTKDLILNQENATDIVGSVLACDTSDKAARGVDAIYHKLEEMNQTSSLNDMVSEATAPQVQPENSGPSK